MVLREETNEYGKSVAHFMSLGAFTTWMANERVLVEREGKNGDLVTKLVPVVPLWLQSPDRRSYKGVTFAPGGSAPKDHYNLWQGFAVNPMPGSLADASAKCGKLLAHVKDNLCSGNADHARYLISWAADMLQDPGKKKGVALVLRGKKGTGKSIFVEALASLLGHHAFKGSQTKHLTGNFNRHLADKLLVVAEESVWSGDRGSEGVLKDLITSSTITIEAKGVDAIEVPSLCRIALVTNNEWAVPASADERRYFVLDVGEGRMQDRAYFAAIADELDNGGREAFLSLLLQWPLKGVDVGNVPQTDALQRQKVRSFEPFEQFVYDLLSGALIEGAEFALLDCATKQAVYDTYLEASRKRGKVHLMDFAQFCKKFMVATGSTAGKATRDGKGQRAPIFKFRDMAARVAAFRQYANVDIDE
jgi:phage/plasmid-associated DNA primase